MDNEKTRIDEEFDPWKSAQDFLKDYFPENFEDKFVDYFNKRDFNKNEVRLFKAFCGEWIEFHLTMAILKKL